MSKTVYTLLLGYLAICDAFLSPVSLSNDTLSKIQQQTSIQKASQYCNLEILQYAQGSFNLNLGLPDEMNWMNGAELAKKVDNLLMTNVKELMDVCRQHQLFVHYSGAYESCMNQWFLLRNTEASLQDVFEYVHMFLRLDFICNSGFEEVANQWDCLHPIQSSTEYQTCLTALRQAVESDATKLCSDVETFMKCTQKVAYNACNNSKSAGWWGCEESRVGFARECHNLRCYVADSQP